MNSKIPNSISNRGERKGLKDVLLLFRFCSSMFNYLLCKYELRLLVNIGKIW